jgi:hypothetical protein|tara:strand:+ start:1480 stop:1995 length:516 start_codon:yes stop_codon:yes gene_type:complete
MRKIIVIFFLFLLLSCNEKESNEKSSYKSKYDIVDTSKFENQNSKTDPYGILDITYAVIVSQQDICDIYNNSFKESKNKGLLQEYMMPQLEKCKFYREVYKKVIPNFESVNLDNVNKYYYFNYSNENSETSFSNVIGIFLDINNCNKTKEEFLDKEMGLTSKCKNITKLMN